MAASVCTQWNWREWSRARGCGNIRIARGSGREESIEKKAVREKREKGKRGQGKRETQSADGDEG